MICSIYVDIPALRPVLYAIPRVPVSRTVPRVLVSYTVLRVPELACTSGTGPDLYARVTERADGYPGIRVFRAKNYIELIKVESMYSINTILLQLKLCGTDKHYIYYIQVSRTYLI